MSSNTASGSEVADSILRLARIRVSNPQLEFADRSSGRRGRSLIEREVTRLITSIESSRTFSLIEVVDLVADALNQPDSGRRLLLAPPAMLDAIAPGRGVRLIRDYLEEILRLATEEVILMAPFWDVDTLTSLLRTVPRDAKNASLVLLLVDTIGTVRVEPLVSKIQAVWPSTSLRLYIHRRGGTSSESDYPHAKCLLVDQRHGYVGSANFTDKGMTGHFELGVRLPEEDCHTLGQMLTYLWSESGLFSLAWSASR